MGSGVRLWGQGLCYGVRGCVVRSGVVYCGQGPCHEIRRTYKAIGKLNLSVQLRSK